MRLHVGIFQNINISFEICANPFKMLILHRKFIYIYIYINVFQLIQNVNIASEICANVSGSCADPFKMLIFHLKYV